MIYVYINYLWFPFAATRERNLDIYLFRIQEHSHNIQETTNEGTIYKWKTIREKTTNFWLKVMWRKALTSSLHHIFVGFYLKGSSNSHKFYVGYNPQEASTSTSYNMFFIKQQLEKRLQSLNHNTKSRIMVTWYKFPQSSLLICFSSSILFLFCYFSWTLSYKMHNTEKFVFHSTMYIL